MQILLLKSGSEKEKRLKKNDYTKNDKNDIM